MTTDEIRRSLAKADAEKYGLKLSSADLRAVADVLQALGDVAPTVVVDSLVFDAHRLNVTKVEDSYVLVSMHRVTFDVSEAEVAAEKARVAAEALQASRGRY